MSSMRRWFRPLPLLACLLARSAGGLLGLSPAASAFTGYEIQPETLPAYYSQATASITLMKEARLAAAAQELQAAAPAADPREAVLDRSFRGSVHVNFGTVRQIIPLAVPGNLVASAVRVRLSENVEVTFNAPAQLPPRPFPNLDVRPSGTPQRIDSGRYIAFWLDPDSLLVVNWQSAARGSRGLDVYWVRYKLRDRSGRSGKRA